VEFLWVGVPKLEVAREGVGGERVVKMDEKERPGVLPGEEGFWGEFLLRGQGNPNLRKGGANGLLCAGSEPTNGATMKKKSKRGGPRETQGEPNP